MRKSPLIRTASICMVPATCIEKCTKLPLKWGLHVHNSLGAWTRCRAAYAHWEMCALSAHFRHQICRLGVPKWRGVCLGTWVVGGGLLPSQFPELCRYVASSSYCCSCCLGNWLGSTKSWIVAWPVGWIVLALIPHHSPMPLCFQRNFMTFMQARPMQMIFISTSIHVHDFYKGSPRADDFHQYVSISNPAHAPCCYMYDGCQLCDKRIQDNVIGSGRKFCLKGWISYLRSTSQRGPMGGAPYIQLRLGDGPIFKVSVSHLDMKERPGKLPTLSSCM